MVMCSVCKENVAVVFIAKLIEGKQKQEGLCLSCAKKQGIQPINQLLEQTGISDDDIEGLNKQVGDLFENMDFSKSENKDNQNDTNPFFSFINKAFSKNEDENDDKDKEDEKPDKSSHKNNDSDIKKTTRVKTQDKRNIKKRKYLDTYGTNLIDSAISGKIDRVIGRKNEINRVIQILNRRTKNNPVLLGEPGVGKTAIAEGLAVRVAEKEVPSKLFNVEIYQLDLTSLVAGTQFRGQFESRMKGVIEEAKNIGNVILVIDELQNIMGAGEAEGAMNAANILKPALARGEVQILGATTITEYRKYIEKDSALERRFQPVMVDEPSTEETFEILKGIRDYYQDFHKVLIPDKVLRTTIDFSERYIADRFLPDKAIDIIDEAGSKANLNNEALIELEKVRDSYKKVQREKENAISADSIEDYQKAADLKVRECNLVKEITRLEKQYKDLSLTIDDIADIVEQWTKIPVQRLTEVETSKLLNLEKRLHKRIIGQNEAVISISKSIRRSRSGFKRRKKPGSFIFIGPTGVGKTELVKALASELFGSEESLIRLDMSEYMEKHTVSKLIGAPPGYVGYDEAGQLTEKVRRKPYSIILMDEIEKAHIDVFNMLLQVLEDGRLTDSHGRMVNFENTIFILTSNAGTSFKKSGIGFNNENYESLKSHINNVLKQTFRPEFLNRIDETIVFTELSKKELNMIVDLMLKEVIDEGKSKEMTITISKKMKEFILKDGYDIKYGARPLRRSIQKHVEDLLSEEYIKNNLKPKSKICVDYKDSKVVIEIE
ncbi:MAG: ATP-dependent Clp protease ATP-binding subunit [Clostridiales bacterium]